MTEATKHTRSWATSGQQSSCGTWCLSWVQRWWFGVVESRDHKKPVKSHICLIVLNLTQRPCKFNLQIKWTIRNTIRLPEKGKDPGKSWKEIFKNPKKKRRRWIKKDCFCFKLIEKLAEDHFLHLYLYQCHLSQYGNDLNWCTQRERWRRK